MHRVFKLAIGIGEQLCVSKRCSSITSTAFIWNPIKYSQYLDLGRQAFRVYAVKTLIDQHPDLPADVVNDVADGLTYESHIFWKLKDSILMKTAENSNDVLAKIGEFKRKNDDSALTEVFEELEKNCLSSLSSQDIISLIKAQHPKFLLRRFCDLAKIKLYTSSYCQENGSYFAKIFFEDELVSTMQHEKQEEAEHIACLSTIRNKFSKEFNDINLGDFDEIPLERDVDIGREHRQRVVNIIKSPDEEFGFTIRGGQQKVTKNKDYLQVTIITPILITDVKECSPAETCGLRIGDILLGVNDHALKNKTHEQAVITIKKFLKKEEVFLTVHYNKHELLKYEAEQNLLERELVRVTEEIKSKSFGKWHESKSKVDPMQYFMEQFVEKKVKYQAKKGGNINRLWHQYKGPKRVSQNKKYKKLPLKP